MIECKQLLATALATTTVRRWESDDERTPAPASIGPSPPLNRWGCDVRDQMQETVSTDAKPERNIWYLAVAGTRRPLSHPFYR